MSGLRIVSTCPDILRAVDHCCAACETDCTEVTRLRMRVRELEREAFRLAVALRESRDLTAFAREELEARWPETRAA